MKRVSACACWHCGERGRGGGRGEEERGEGQGELREGGDGGGRGPLCIYVRKMGSDINLHKISLQKILSVILVP